MNPYQPAYNKILASFLPSIAMKRAITNILRYDGASVGLQNSNISEEYYNYKVESAFYMFSISFFISLMLGIYLTNVIRR